jgi:hypothetical protein
MNIHVEISKFSIKGKGKFFSTEKEKIKFYAENMWRTFMHIA